MRHQSIVDAWTPAHAALGLLAGLTRVPRPAGYIGILGIEIIRIVLERNNILPPQSRQNRLGDIAVTVLGFEGGRKAANMLRLPSPFDRTPPSSVSGTRHPKPKPVIDAEFSRSNGVPVGRKVKV